ncbi:MAG TPA: NAD(P)H-hydrate dehydratase [Candidatus Angelobacter sp.]|nr:NAD(P)H-hydrate dehydratase [Candidatus Angelobacter sp.]
MKIVTAEEMRVIDRATTEKHGVPSLTLMENAGAAVAKFAQKHFDFETVCAVCGRGNNGGDGFVAARKLHEAGKKVSVIVLGKSFDDLRGDAAEMFRKLPVEPLWAGDEERFGQAEVEQTLRQADLILDAIVGTGFKPPLQGVGERAVAAINACTAPVVSVDLPSGSYTDSFLPAKVQGLMARSDGVITFTAPKPVHVFGGVTEGPIAVADIGSPQELLMESGSLDLEVTAPAYLYVVFHPREAETHKGNFGHVLVIGGSVGKAGAAAMAGIAALRSGAGLVTVACPRSVQPTVAAFAPEIMTEPLPETEDGTIAESARERIEALLGKKDVVVLGPGLSRNSESDRLARELVAKIGGETRLVLDADGLNAFAGRADELHNEGLLILTPHPAEMARLTGVPTPDDHPGRIRTAREVAKKHRAIVVLKGHRTVTASPSGTVWINMSGNPGMAKGGSGDVLSGIIAAVHTQIQGGLGRRQSRKWYERMTELMRQSEEGDAAAARELEELSTNSTFYMFTMVTALGVCLHGLAGDVARDLCGEASMLATDIVNNIGESIALGRRAAADSKFFYLQL